MKLRPTTLLGHALPPILQKFRSLGFSKDSTMIAAISAPVEHCWRLVDALKSEYPVHLGCISAPLLDPRRHNKPFTYNISLLAIPPAVNHTPFISSVPGPEPVAVGRLRRPERAKESRMFSLSEEVARTSSEWVALFNTLSPYLNDIAGPQRYCTSPTMLRKACRDFFPTTFRIPPK